MSHPFFKQCLSGNDSLLPHTLEFSTVILQGNCGCGSGIYLLAVWSLVEWFASQTYVTALETLEITTQASKTREVVEELIALEKIKLQSQGESFRSYPTATTGLRLSETDVKELRPQVSSALRPSETLNAVRNVPLNTHPRTDVQPSQSFEWWQSTGCRPIFEHVFMRVLGGRFSVKWAIKLGMTNQRATSHTGSLVHPSSGLAGLGTNSEQTLPSAFALAEPTAELDDDTISIKPPLPLNDLALKKSTSGDRTKKQLRKRDGTFSIELAPSTTINPSSEKMQNSYRIALRDFVSKLDVEC